jgi:RNA polymerase sigma-70 factor (ECF subfamily)
LAHIKNQQKTRRHFSAQTLQEIEKTAAARLESMDDRLWALRKCIEKLSTNDRQLLILRYEIGASLKSVSERLRQSVNTLYNRLYRIRILLMHCIEKTIGKENLPG